MLKHGQTYRRENLIFHKYEVSPQTFSSSMCKFFRAYWFVVALCGKSVFRGKVFAELHVTQNKIVCVHQTIYDKN